MRSIWSGTVQFGVVAIPVKLYTAVREQAVRFNQLHRTDHGRIELRRYCSTEETEVPFTDIVKGFEYTRGRYVVVEPAEIDALKPERSHTIEIEDFVDLAGIDPVYYVTSYYLGPDKGGEKPYQLLLDAMRDREKVGIATAVLFGRERLIAIRPIGRALGLVTMNFEDEIVPNNTVPGIPEQEPGMVPREREMARQLVDSWSAPFDPSKYKDTYRQAVLAMIERKAKGEQIEMPEAPPKPTPAPDLMAALQQSLEDIQRRSGRKPARKRTARAPSAKPAAARKRKPSTRD